MIIWIKNAFPLSVYEMRTLEKTLEKSYDLPIRLNTNRAYIIGGSNSTIRAVAKALQFFHVYQHERAGNILLEPVEVILQKEKDEPPAWAKDKVE